jgi:hypothetical protein
MSTTLDIQNDVSLQLGKNDGAIANVKRDQAIIRAKRKFYHEFPWSFLKKNDTLTFASGVAAFPTDYDLAYEPKMYTYSGNLKTEYKLVATEDVNSYTQDYPVFAIDIENAQFLTNKDGDVEISYHLLVPDTTDMAYVEPANDITAIVLLAIGYFWLASERNTENFDRFNTLYKEELSRLVRMDRLKEPVRYLNIDTTDYGYGE